MVDKLGTVTLKSGEEADLFHLTAPEPEWRDRILPYLAHKGHSYLWPMELGLAEGLPTLRMNFFSCVLNGKMVGNITTVEGLTPALGLLQHVYTDPEQRRKGICRHLMEALCADFQQRGGAAMYLGTGFETPPYWIYHSFGFRGIGTTGAMVWLPEADFLARHFAPGATTIRETQWSDWPCLDALYLTVEGWYLRGYLYAQYGHSSYEGVYPLVSEMLQQGSVLDMKILAQDNEAVMGQALLTTDSRWSGQPYLLEFFLHPNFYAEGERLLAYLSIPTDRKVLCYADAAATERCAILEASGFTREATLARQIKRGEKWLDAYIYSRG